MRDCGSVKLSATISLCHVKSSPTWFHWQCTTDPAKKKKQSGCYLIMPGNCWWYPTPRDCAHKLSHNSQILHLRGNPFGLSSLPSEVADCAVARWRYFFEKIIASVLEQTALEEPGKQLGNAERCITLTLPRAANWNKPNCYTALMQIRAAASLYSAGSNMKDWSF